MEVVKRVEAGRDGIRNQGREEQGEPTLKEFLEGILSKIRDKKLLPEAQMCWNELPKL